MLDKSPFYCKDGSSIRQGDILEGVISYKIEPRIYGEPEGNNHIVSSFSYPYSVVISQDCDLAQCDNISHNKFRNAFLPHVLLLPAFLEEYYYDGIIHKDIYNIEQQPKSKKDIEKIQKNQEDRYFYLRACESFSIKKSIIDFKCYVTIPYDLIVRQHKKTYRATINSIFRENLSRRFTTYLSRIALPQLDEC